MQQSGAWQLIVTGLMSMLPVIELKGTIPAGLALGYPLWEVFLVAYLFSCLPVPFIQLLLSPLMRWMRNRPGLRSFINKQVDNSMKKADRVKKYSLLGLFIFVAIPLPGTGVWTGSIIAATLALDIKKATPIIWLGNLVAGIAILAISYGILGA